MATENSNYDPLRNPQVDYDRTDLSPRGILLFLVGLLICGVFVELVIWGMFRFMAKSDVLFPQPPANPMAATQPMLQQPGSRSILQNAPAVNLDVFPAAASANQRCARHDRASAVGTGFAESAAAVQGLQRERYIFRFRRP